MPEVIVRFQRGNFDDVRQFRAHTEQSSLHDSLVGDTKFSSDNEEQLRNWKKQLEI